MNVVRCNKVRRQFGAITALNDVSFHVEEGEIFGFLGPQGSGKTTLIQCLLGLDQPTSGVIEIFGHHPVTDQHVLAPRVGYTLHAPALIPRLSVAENMRFFSSLYNKAVPWKALLTSLGLEDVKRTKVQRLPQNQQQKLSIALCFLHQPDLLLLDEFSNYLAPQECRDIWEAINTMCDYGTTVIITTRNLEEAERRCDRVGLLDNGKLLTVGTVSSLIRGYVGESSAFLSLDQPLGPQVHLEDIAGVTRIVQEGLSLTAHGHGCYVHRILAHLAAQRIQVTELEITEPKFEDVFYNLTGRKMNEAAAKP